MFLKLTKSGGRHYAQLVESFRNEDGKPRQRTICTLGRLEPGGDVDKLIAALQRARGLDATPIIQAKLQNPFLIINKGNYFNFKSKLIA